MADEKKDEKNEKGPYGNYSIQDVIEAEAGHYVIQVGGDLFSYNGKMAFSRDRTNRFYVDILNGLNHMKEHGSELEKEDALRCLLFLRVYPLRIH